MEIFTRWIVQFYDAKYELWCSVIERSDRLFEVPQVGYDTEAAGREKLASLRSTHPTATYRLVRETTTIEEIA